MPPATVTRGAATRAAILDRGVDLASAEGLEALSIGRLASELEMSKSGLFAHFGSKQDLQLATVAAAGWRFRVAVLDPALEAPEGAPRLRAIAAALDFWLAELERQARIAGAAQPNRLAFELYAVVMGANSRYRLSGDRRVYGYAREAIERLLAEVGG